MPDLTAISGLTGTKRTGRDIVQTAFSLYKELTHIPYIVRKYKYIYAPVCTY